MKRYLAIMLCIMLSILVYFGGNKLGLLDACGRAGVGYELMDKNLVKIDVENVEDILEYLDIETISKTSISDRVIIEGYSSKLEGYRCVDGMRVNIQISVGEDYALLGSPLINGSF